MKKTSIIIFAIFAFIFFIFAVSGLAQDETRVSAAWRVLKYDITAAVPQNAADRNLTAKAILTLQNVGNGAGSRLTLRISSKAEVSSVTVNNSTASFTKNEEPLGASGRLQRIIVSLPSVQPNATVPVSVEYKLKIDENSGLNALSPAGSQFLPLSFWYPTPNNPFSPRGADFAPFRLNISAASGDSVIASGKGSGTNFDQTLNGQPFFITGKWIGTSKIGANIEVFLPVQGNSTVATPEDEKRAGELMNLAQAAQVFTANLLGKSPDIPLKIVAVRRGGGFSDGGTILLNYSAFRRQKIDSQTAMIVSESIAKIFLGNAAQVRGEGYGVIREGLSRFIATQFIEKQFGKDVANIERLRQRTAYASIAQRDAPLSTVLPLDDFYYMAVANKGTMIWRLLAKTISEQEFFNVVRTQIQSGNLTLSNLREAFPTQKTFLDYAFSQTTDMNLLAGLPRVVGAETKVALRNVGSLDAAVNVVATTDKGEKLTTQTLVPAKSFGEVSFKTASKVVRAEIDAEKLYPQIDFSDDVAPREIKESDPILSIKRAFDKKDFAAAEKNARVILQNSSHFDDARTWLGRALLEQGKIAEAEREFRAVLEEKLPSAQSLAWANVGLGEIAAKSNQTAQAVSFFNEAIKADAEYGATFSARAGRNKIQANLAIDETVKTFFAQFDKAAVSGRKSELDALILSGEISKFSSGIGGQAQQWETRLLQVDKIDADNLLAEVSLNIKILNKDPESGTAIYQLTRVGNAWKLSGVEIFEVR